MRLTKVGRSRMSGSDGECLRASTNLSRTILCIITGLTIGLSTGALAADAEQTVTGPSALGTSPAQANEAPLAEVTVTGSRIQRAGLETPTPVTTVTSSDLQDLNPGQLVSGLSELPQFSGNQTPQTNAPLFSGGSNLNLRDAGASRTLVLLNGRRLPSGNRYGDVDVSTLPDAVVTSVETVTGGASAAYGTDAVAGVVNFIVDTKFNGLKGKVQYGETSRSDGDNRAASLTFGHSLGERGHILLSGDYFDEDPIWATRSLQNRPWFASETALISDPTHQYTYITRNNVIPTNTAVGGIINAPGTPLDKLLFQNTGSGVTTTPLQITGVGAINGGSNSEALPSPDKSLGIDADNTIQQQNGRRSGFLYVDYDVTDNDNVYLQAIYGLSEVKGPWFENPILEGGSWGATVFSGNPFLPANVQAIMTADHINSVGFGETAYTGLTNAGNLGTYQVKDVDKMNVTTLGFTHKFGDGFMHGWKLDAYGQFGANHQDQHFEGGVITSNLFLALDAVTNPATGAPACRAALVNPAAFGSCVPIDLFGGVNSVSAAAANYVLDANTNVKSAYYQTFSEATLNGPIFKGIGAGDFLMAFGASYREDSLKQWKADLHDEFVFINGVNTGYRGLIPENLPNGMLGVRAGSVPPGFTGNSSLSNVLFTGSIQNPTTVLTGDFNVKEVFTEFDLPLLKDKPFAKDLDTNFAYRWADYTGSGAISSWKYGATWQVDDQFRLRATKSRDVRAANIRERFDATAGGATVTDPLFNNTVIQTNAFTGGNPAVSPEKADTITAGAVFQATGIAQGFSASVDWYDININGALGQITQQNLVNECYIQHDQDLCQYITRDPVTNQITSIRSIFLNLSNQTIRGVDAEIRYDKSVNFLGHFVDSGAERIGARSFINHVIENSNLVPGSSGRDFLSLEFPAWTAVNELTYNNGPVRVNFQGRWLDRHTLNRTYNTGLVGSPTVDDNEVPSVFYVDMNLGYDFTLYGTKLNLYGTVHNLLDRSPPATPALVGSGGVTGPNPTLYDTIGRAYTIGLRFQFL